MGEICLIKGAKKSEINRKNIGILKKEITLIVI
nr:hypothetical protein BN993_06400 [Virgibacillus halodenitrificans]